MRASSLSRRYAEAFADVAQKEGQLERARAELLALADAFAASRDLQTVISTASRSRQEKTVLFRKLGTSLELSEPTNRLLEYLVQKRRLDLLGGLARSFAEETDRRLGIVRGVLAVARPLREEQKQRITAVLQRKMGRKVVLTEEIDESLIAGFQVKTAGRIFDGSLRGQLKRIKERLAHGARTIHTA